MGNALKRMAFWIGLMVAGNICAMNSSLSMEKAAQVWGAKAKENTIRQERRAAPDRVINMFERVNDQNREGCASLHCLMVCRYASLAQVELLIKNGASLDIKSKDGEDPYNYAVLYKGHSPEGDLKTLCLYNKRIVNYVHSEMLRDKLQGLAVS